jgi:hypothetical protein
MSWALGQVTRLYTRALGQDIESRHTWDTHIRLSSDATAELEFWLRCFDRFNGTRAIWEPTRVHSVVFCDAAGRSPSYLGGWGAWTLINGKLAQARGN